MSPSSTVPSKPARKSGMDSPNWPTTILPVGSAISGNSSCCSRMPGRHRGAEQHRVHLVAGVAQGVLDDVEGDRVDVDRPNGVVVGLDDAWPCSRSCRSGQAAGRMRMRADRVHGAGVAGQHEGGGVHLGDDRPGPATHVAGQQLRRGRRAGLASSRRRRRPWCRRDRRRRRVGAALRQLRRGHVAARGRCTTARRLTSSCSASRAKVNSRLCSASKVRPMPASPLAVELRPASTSTGTSKPWPW